jgi:hypothetical protein
METEHRDAPLPATLRFTLTFGALVAVGWIALFLLLRSRW